MGESGGFSPSLFPIFYKIMTYYFAYGSNMDERQMKERCPDSKLIRKAVLKNYRLAFTIYSQKRKCGCADIIKSKGDKVYGLLYTVTESDLNTLDRFEGHPIHYKRFQIKLDNDILAETYEVVNKEVLHQVPSKEYLKLLTESAKNHRFPEKYQNFLKTFIEHAK